MSYFILIYGTDRSLNESKINQSSSVLLLHSVFFLLSVVAYACDAMLFESTREYARIRVLETCRAIFQQHNFSDGKGRIYATMESIQQDHGTESPRYVSDRALYRLIRITYRLFSGCVLFKTNTEDSTNHSAPRLNLAGEFASCPQK